MEDGSRKVCPDCWSSIQVVTRDLPLYEETMGKLADTGVVDGLVTLFVFEKGSALQNIVHALKYRGIESLGRELGMRIGQRMKTWGVTGDVLIPIPLHRAKLRERGFNQSRLIAEGISIETGIPLSTRIVRRRKYTVSQTTLSLDEREANVAAAFEVPRKRVSDAAGRTIVLVDDIITTGATIKACAGELVKAGAKGVVAASAALAQ